MITPIITLTTGHISIKRGKKIRQYLPGFISTLRLTSLLVNTNSPVNLLKYTQRSSIYEWRGLGTLDEVQISLLKLYISSVNQYHKSKEHCDLFYMLGIRDACLAAGIHSTLIEMITPCEHGNARSTCITCATMM